MGFARVASNHIHLSSLHGPNDHSLELAPIYDVLSTIALDQRPGPKGSLVGDSTRMEQTVNETSDVLLVSRAIIESEATHWGLRHSSTQVVVDELLLTMRDTLHTQLGDEATISAIGGQLRRLWR